MSTNSIARMALITAAVMLGVSILNGQFPSLRRLTKGG